MDKKTRYDYTLSKASFINPYNFVPIPVNNKVNRKNAELSETNSKDSLFSGKIYCSIHTKTGIAVPDTANKWEDRKVAKHYHYPFMRTPDGYPMIPASSLRGVVRNVFEVLTDSCFSTMRDDTILTARTPSTAAYHAGFLIFNKTTERWTLHSAKKYMLRTKRATYSSSQNPKAWDDRICTPYEVNCNENGERYIEFKGIKKSGAGIYFKKLLENNGDEVIYMSRRGIGCAPLVERLVTKEEMDQASNKKQYGCGILVLGEPIYNKHHESVFVPEGSAALNYSNDKVNKALQGLEATLEMYNDSAINRNLEDEKDPHLGYRSYERMKKNGIIPVWYNDINGHLYLSFACIGRMAFENTLNDLVGERKPCTCRDNMCPACRLFGKTGDKSLGSRVSFTDAVYTGDRADLHDHVLAELGSPNISYMPFYTNVTEQDYEQQEKNNFRRRKLPPGYDDRKIQIRGRKFYWHSTNFDMVNHQQGETNRNGTFEVLKLGEQEKFGFEISFRNISAEELRELVYSLNLYENGGKYCHKIGHGKPIGLGSINITVERIEQRTFSLQNGYKISEYIFDYSQKPTEVKEGSETIQSLKEILDYSKAKETEYPGIVPPMGVQPGPKDNGLARHKWFTENTAFNQNNRNRNLQTLPRILDKNQELRKFDAKIIGRNR